MGCVLNAQTNRYLPEELASLTTNYETDYFYYDYATNTLNCKLMTKNIYHPYLKQIYPAEIDENQLSDDMINVLKSYTDSRSNECYMKTNLNLLGGDVNTIDWIYVNKLRSLIRGLIQSNIKHIYYRGLMLSDTEILYYMEKCNEFYYTTSFSSFTTDRLLVYSGNAILILKIDLSNQIAKKNLANIWKWSTFLEEKEALLAVGTKLKILSVHYFGYKWEIEVELAEEDFQEQDEYKSRSK